MLGGGKRSFKIELEDQYLKQTDEFVHFGGVMNSVKRTEAAVKREIGVARGEFSDVEQSVIGKGFEQSFEDRRFRSPGPQYFFMQLRNLGYYSST